MILYAQIYSRLEQDYDWSGSHAKCYIITWINHKSQSYTGFPQSVLVAETTALKSLISSSTKTFGNRILQLLQMQATIFLSIILELLKRQEKHKCDIVQINA